MIAAVVLAAGESKRMGQPKMVLPWGDTTVIGQVVRVLTQAGLQDIVVVTGGARHRVEAALKGLPARPVFNRSYAENEMSMSLRVGLSCMGERVEAALVALGDQPQMELAVVQAVLSKYRETRSELVIPSYRMRRGHPWVIARPLWPAVLNLKPGETLRDLMNANSASIYYLPVNTASILRDLDTQADYDRERP